ncbi:MAG: hypothetical protein OEV42_07755 [Deltaproteobacteria bacterium]|nr:hypothetical protein [Deltaproteobacteria bacterium]
MTDSVEIREKILSYLLKNPEAGDTLEGIAQWWMIAETIDNTVDLIGGVLDEMVSKGKIERHSSSGERTVYRINPVK